MGFSKTAAFSFFFGKIHTLSAPGLLNIRPGDPSICLWHVWFKISYLHTFTVFGKHFHIYIPTIPTPERMWIASFCGFTMNNTSLNKYRLNHVILNIPPLSHHNTQLYTLTYLHIHNHPEIEYWMLQGVARFFDKSIFYLPQDDEIITKYMYEQNW